MGWESGKIIAERYRLEEPIGEGGMGMVWRAEHIKLRSPVAIKVLPQRVAADDRRSARFIREAQAAAAIRSTNVVQVLDYGVDEGVAYIAMEFLDGESLADRLDRKTRLSPRETLVVISQVAKAIAQAHKKGIVHRDLKPANIFLAREDDGEVVKVLDFGIAKLTGNKKGTDQTTQTGHLLGTPNYMSPEQTRGHRVVDHRTDIWSLGIVAFECLVGERPIDGETVGDIIYKICSEEMPKPSRVAPVPIGFDAWFRKATQREPDSRFRTAREMSKALAAAMGEDVPISDPDSVDSFDRLSLELSDTLAAKRASERAPDSHEGDDVRERATLDSEPLDAIGAPRAAEESPSATHASATPPDTGDGGRLDVEVGEAAALEDEASVSTPPEVRTGAGESLRGAAALARTTDETSGPMTQRRWLIGLGLVVIVGAGWYVTSGAAPGAAPAPSPARSPAASSSAGPTPKPSAQPRPDPTATPAAPEPAPLPEVSANASPSASTPRGRPPAPQLPGQRAAPPPKAAPAPSVQPPAAGSGKIDFGI